MSEQTFGDDRVSDFGPGSGAETCDRQPKTGLARFLPDSTTLVTLASVISFAILVTGCVGTAGIVPKAGPLAAAAVGIDARSAPVALDAQWWRSFGDVQRCWG